jgi:hypothetical protein
MDLAYTDDCHARYSWYAAFVVVGGTATMASLKPAIEMEASISSSLSMSLIAIPGNLRFKSAITAELYNER